MFYLRYLGSELRRRRGRTILTVLGLAVGVCLVIVISALTRGLDRAQASALNPLTSIGTDLTVTREADQDASTGFGGPGGGGPGGGEVVDSNRSVLTDLSKLGKPGAHFVHDFFLAGTQLTFPQGQTKQIAQTEGVEAASSGLTLVATHQEGVVPKIVAKVQTGGDTIDVLRRIEPPTQAELAKVQACIEKAGGTTQQRQQPNGGGGLGQAPPGGGFGVGGGAFQNCLPDRFRRLRATITTPRETLRQVLDPPQTNITTKPYTIGGIDQRHPTLALVTPSQVRRGRYLQSAGGRQALVATTYAANNGLRVGSKLNLNGTRFRVVGLIEPPLGGQSADVYLPLSELQKLAGLEGRVNVALVRATDSASVSDVENAIEKAFPSATVASSQQVADTINGSLVDAADLSKTLGLALSLVAAGAAFLLAALLTLSSVGKRVRELGTLKAIGWRQRLVVRQVVAESLTQGAAGGLLGVALGVAAALAMGAFGPTLTASSTAGGSLFGVELARTATRTVSLSAPLSPGILALGLGLALLGGALAGAAGALRAARLRPADAMRQVD